MNDGLLRKIIMEEIQNALREEDDGVGSKETREDLKNKHQKIFNNLIETSGKHWRIVEESEHPAMDFAKFECDTVGAVFSFYEDVDQSKKHEMRIYRISLGWKSPLGGYYHLMDDKKATFGKVVQSSLEVWDKIREAIKKHLATSKQPY